MKQSIIAFCLMTGLLGTSFTVMHKKNGPVKMKQACLCEKSCTENNTKQITAPVTLLPLVNII